MDGREERGKAIAETSQIRRIDDSSYKVHSQTQSRWYDVYSDRSGWACSCPDSSFREVKCKHVWAVEFSLDVRREVEARRIEPVNVSACLCCGSGRIVKDGIRHNRAVSIQLWTCKDCNRYFSFNLGFEGMRASPQAITSAMQLYFTGESLRNVQKFLRLQGVTVSHVAVLKWIRKYVRLMEGYVDRIKPKARGDLESRRAILEGQGQHEVSLRSDGRRNPLLDSPTGS